MVDPSFVRSLEMLAGRCLIACAGTRDAAHEARAFNRCGNTVFKKVEVFARDVISKRKAQRTLCSQGVDAHGGEDMRGGGRSG